MTATLTGIITDIFPPEIFAKFSKRVFWMKQSDRERFPQHWAIEVHGDAMKYLADFNIADVVEVEVNVLGYHWEKGGREGIILSLKATSLKLVERINDEKQKPVYVPSKPNPPAPPKESPQTDLPF